MWFGSLFFSSFTLLAQNLEPMNTQESPETHEEHGHSSEHGVDLPIPTAWPILCAFSLTLMVSGLVLSLIITLCGLVIGLIAAVGWFRAVFPTPKHEIVPFVDPHARPEPIKFVRRRISHLRYGELGHRVRLPVRIHRYSSGIWGGIAGGIAMAILAMLYGQVTQGSIWYPINLMAASGVPALADASLATLRQFSAPGLIVGILAHGALSIMVGLLYTVLLPMLPARFEWLFGGILTPLIWTALLFPAFDLISPALSQRVDWVWFLICQVSFGVVGGFVVYKSQKVETMQSWPLAQRMGVHAMEKDEEEH
jgi:hypothetical protein